MPRGAATWTADVEHDLMLCLYGQLQPGKDILAKLAEEMAAKGHDLTWDAIR